MATASGVAGTPKGGGKEAREVETGGGEADCHSLSLQLLCSAPNCSYTSVSATEGSGEDEFSTLHLKYIEEPNARLVSRPMKEIISRVAYPGHNGQGGGGHGPLPAHLHRLWPLHPR